MVFVTLPVGMTVVLVVLCDGGVVVLCDGGGVVVLVMGMGVVVVLVELAGGSVVFPDGGRVVMVELVALVIGDEVVGTGVVAFGEPVVLVEVAFGAAVVVVLVAFGAVVVLVELLLRCCVGVGVIVGGSVDGIGEVDGAGVVGGRRHDDDNGWTNSFTQYRLVVLEVVTFELFDEDDDIGDFMQRMFIVAACCASQRKR